MKNYYKILFKYLGLIGLLLLPNLVLMAISIHLSLARPLLNIDYYIALLLVMVGFRKIGLSLFFIIYCVDVILLIGQVFPFFRLDDIIYIIKFLFISSTYYKITLVIGLLLGFLFVFLYFKIKLKKTSFLIFFNILALVFVTESILSIFYLQTTEKNIISSQSVEFTQKQFDGFNQTLNLPKKTLVDLKPTGAAKNLFLNLEQKAKANNGVLLIVSESFGMPKDPAIFAALIQPLKSNIKYEEYNEGHFSYIGATLHGELRELCHAHPQNFNLKQLTQGFEHCLPHQLAQYGYQSTAMHGALGIMYDRKFWYPRAGFEQTIFFENYSWARRCYSFPGACDIDMMSIVEQTFTSPSKQFFYWLTLNTHAIYDARDIHIQALNCAAFNIPEHSATCRNFQLHAQFFSQLSHLLRKPVFKGVEVIIVGDHTPPILNNAEKEKYFLGNDVAWISFKIK